MLSYLAFIHHGIESAGNPLNDGKTLAQSCIRQLEALNDPDQFPPRLLILLASPAYLESLKSEQLLHGVSQTFSEFARTLNYRDVPLIGCSVAAVFFSGRIHREGALLICLASRLLDARVQASPDVNNDSKEAVRSLLRELNLVTERGEEKHSFANRTLIALLPGFGGRKYLAPELHDSLREQLRARIPIFGGVASANDPERIRSGVLFANEKVYRNAIVAASVECGTPFGISLTQGLTDTGKTLNVAELDPQDRRIIRRFREGNARDAVRDAMATVQQDSSVPLFANMALDRDPTVDTPTFEAELVKLTREVDECEPFHVLVPEPKKMQLAFRDGVRLSLQQAFLLNPIGGIGFRCAGLLRNFEKIGLDLEQEIAVIEHDLSFRDNPINKSFVGGFVDGEAGQDRNGKSVLGNWSNATLALGDELRFRTPVYRGFEELASFAGMKGADTLTEGVNRLTQLVYDIGFPGAMLSFCLREEEQYSVIGQSASGSRYKRILEDRKTYSLDGDDILAKAARENQSQLIVDSRKEECGSMKAASEAGIISQYIVPLTGLGSKVNAVLQIDLGDISYDTGLYGAEKLVLDSLGEIVNSGLNSTFGWEENKIINRLDQALKDSLSAEAMKDGLQKYLEQALEAFGLERGHIRIAQQDKHCLSRVAGIGSYFEASRIRRREIDFGDLSPTAQTFRDEKIIVINDAPNNENHQDMCRRWKEEDEAIGTTLQEVGSYANVPFRSERGERGTINLVSLNTWFFTGFHESALKVLGERVGFLLETLRRKEGESFLFGVSPQLSRIRNLNDMSEVLALEISQFAKTVKAEVASLYLWEEGRQRYVLRAQHGWDRDEWVDAAFYNRQEFWAGTTAVAGVPRHIPDLNDYYTKNFKTNAYPEKTRLYGRYAFGRELSSDFTVEAISLQLRIADADRLGVLTLYRPINAGDESGFATTDTELLQKGADNFAGLIGILQTKRRENWEKQDRARRQKVYDATILAEGTEPFEPRVCRQVFDEYCATRTAFYKVEFIDRAPNITPKVSFVWDSKASKVRRSADSPDQLVRTTVLANRDYDREIKFERLRLEPGEHTNPGRVAVENLISRACVPLVSEKKLVGILDIHWSPSQRSADLPDYQQEQGFLRIMGGVIGSAYGKAETKRQAEIKLREGAAMLDQGKNKLRESEEISSNAIEITTAYVMQLQHELRNMLTEMSGTLSSLRQAVDQSEQETSRQLIEELLQLESETNETLSDIIDMGSRVIAPAKERFRVKSLIEQVLENECERCKKPKIEINLREIADNPSIFADPVLIARAVGNILDNAIKYMQDSEKRVLTIGATTNKQAGTVTISIRDTGPGMSREKTERVSKGSFVHNRRLSVGVRNTKLILWNFGGSLVLDSVEGQGTEARITLPIDHPENFL